VLGTSSVSFGTIQFVPSMQSAQYAIQDRIPTADINNSRKFVTPQRDLLTDHLFTEFKEMSEEFQDYYRPAMGKAITKYGYYHSIDLKLALILDKLTNFKGIGLNLPVEECCLIASFTGMLLQSDPERMTHHSQTWL